MKIIDISQTVDSNTVVWPQDTPFSAEWVMKIQDGASCNVSTMRMSVHCGTHADAPYHFHEEGAKTGEVPIESFVGPCLVVAIESEDAIHSSDLQDVDLNKYSRILFRTKRPCTATTWRDDFAYMGEDAAKILAASSVKLIGIDTPSMDPLSSKTLTAHKIMSQAGLIWIENLELGHVEPGEYELIALPLKLGASDAAPVRAILREMK